MGHYYIDKIPAAMLIKIRESFLVVTEHSKLTTFGMNGIAIFQMMKFKGKYSYLEIDLRGWFISVY